MYQAVCFWKHYSGTLSTASVPSLRPHNHAFFVEDFVLNKRFTVDSGTACSISPIRIIKDNPPIAEIALQMVNHSPMQKSGEISPIWLYTEFLNGFPL